MIVHSYKLNQMSEEIENHVLERYDISKKLGRGAYGIVWRASDKRTKKIVALKKVFEAFQNSVDAQRTYREVMYLQELNGHDNIVRLLSIIRAHNNRDLYLIFEHMETDLHACIKGKILQSIHKQFIFYQLLKGLKYIHSADLIHRDLKPSNLLINSECVIKVADFGLARSVAQKDNGEDPIVSDYVATRWYRAPEILLGSQCYNKAVDMWSAGCILAELISGKVLFTGKSTLNQVELIIELLGRPTNQEIESLGSPLAWNILSNISSQKKRSFTELFSSEGKDALDLLRRLLSFSPSHRMTVEEALRHPYVKQFHCDADEIACKKVIKLPVDDNTKLSLKEYREAIYKDINEKVNNSRKNPQDGLPKINDKIKSLASKDRFEKNDQEISTTLGDKRTTGKDGKPQFDEEFKMRKSSVEPQLAESRIKDKLKVNKSLDLKHSEPIVKDKDIMLQSKAGVKIAMKGTYKSIDGSVHNQKNENRSGLDSNKWFRSSSPPQLINKRSPSKIEEAGQSQSFTKANFKTTNSSLLGDKDHIRVKKSGYIMTGTPSGQHKKSSSQAQVQFSSYNLKSPGKDKKDDKKTSSNYFFKKPKSKAVIEDDIGDKGRSKKLFTFGSQKSFNQFNLKGY